MLGEVLSRLLGLSDKEDGTAFFLPDKNNLKFVQIKTWRPAVYGMTKIAATLCSMPA